MKSAIILLGMATFAGLTEPRGCGEGAGAPASVPVAPLPGVPAKAANDDVGLPANVRVDVQMVSVSVAEAGHLVPALQDRKTVQAAWARVQVLIGRGEARLLAWPVLWLQSPSWLVERAAGIPAAYRNVAESVEEIRYPTEFTPPQVPTVFGPVLLISPTWGADSSIPTAFETQNLGAILEAEAVVEYDGQVITLSLRSRFDRLIGFRRWRTQRSPLGIEGLMEQPDFQTSKITTQLSVHPGEPVLAGVFVFSEPEPHVELFILHARAQLLPPTSVFPPLK